MSGEMGKRISTPPDEVIVFAGHPGFCAWPIFFEIEQVVVQSRVVGFVPWARINE
jgi:hypothetical protein